MLVEIMPISNGVSNPPAQAVQVKYKHYIDLVLLNSAVHFPVSQAGP